MTTEIVATGVVGRRHYRKEIPKEYQQSLDTRLYWLWNQRFGTVQTISVTSTDTLDVTACTLILQAVMAGDLESIMLLFRRLEGGPMQDEEVLERQTLRV